MKKQGFSLIELMVVLVITGILAGVAVPMIFGHVAKSKASELGFSAGTYKKLQMAYNGGNDGLIGSWHNIGFVQNSNSNFAYYEGTAENGRSDGKDTQVSTGFVGAWKAVAKSGLNGCDMGSVWQIDIPARDNGVIQYSTKVTGGAGSACANLTQSFGNFATDGAGIGTP